ncbi:MAG: hypothetical protein IJZ07_08235 [Clostridia bacterium]|nr:hypothetical protein [Clostridia bacterium]
MSDENIKGIPEEENTEIQSEDVLTEATEAAKETAPEETVKEEPEENESEEKAQIDDNSEEAENEEPEAGDESETGINDDDICPFCGENKKAEDSDYCTECEEKMLSRKIPFIAWLGGLAAVVFSVFSLALVFLLTAPSLQVAKADSYAKDKCWYSAYTEYSNVPAVVDEISSILGGESPFVQTGSNLTVKKFDALAHYTSPLEAFYYEGANVEHLEGSLNPVMKDYYEIYNSYLDSYDIVLEKLESEFGETEPQLEELHNAVESLRGTEGMNDIWVDYYHFTFAYNYGESDETRLGYLKAIDESVKKDGHDYSWLYYTEMADLLYSMGDNDGALEYLDKQTKIDKTNFGAYELKMRILLKDNGLEEGEKLLDEFLKYNEGLDTAYVLEAMYLRCAKEYDKAQELCIEALEEYASAPEINRQLALIYLLKGDYDNAFESVFSAYSNALYIAQYYQDQSSLTNQLYYTMYLCSYLETEKGSMTTEHAAEISAIIDDLKEFASECEGINAIINGEKTVEQVLTEGDFDLV